MMAGMSSSAMAETRVYAQDTEPSDRRDGILWVDTSETSRPVYVFSTATDQFEPTAPGNVTVSDTAPTGKSPGHVWVDTSLSRPRAKVYDGTQWNKQIDATEFGGHTGNASAHHSRPTGTANEGFNGGYTGMPSQDTNGNLVSSVTFTFDVGGEFSDEWRHTMQYNYPDYVSSETVYLDGTQMAQWTTVTATESRIVAFSEQNVDTVKVEIISNSNGSIKPTCEQVEYHLISLPTHSHGI